eukprot:12722-Pyramimonas_sp.AAC.1
MRWRLGASSGACQGPYGQCTARSQRIQLGLTTCFCVPIFLVIARVFQPRAVPRRRPGADGPDVPPQGLPRGTQEQR